MQGGLPTVIEETVENDTVDFKKMGLKNKLRIPSSKLNRAQSRGNLRQVGEP